MKMFLFLSVFFCAFAVSANDCNAERNTASESVEILLAANSGGEEKIERRGCCSHHSGVCGCSYSRAACCDGTLSPSCGCD